MNFIQPAATGRKRQQIS